MEICYLKLWKLLKFKESKNTDPQASGIKVYQQAEAGEEPLIPAYNQRELMRLELLISLK